MNFSYIQTQEQFDKACDYYLKCSVIALDTETTALDYFDGEISLIQISDGQKTIVADLIDGTVKDFSKLKELLENPLITVIIHNAKFEHEWLIAKLGIKTTKVFDTFLAAQLIDFNPVNDPKRAHNLAAVMRRYVGEDLDKTEQASDWSVRPLSPEQLEYAALDVIFLPELREALVEEIVAKKLVKVAKIEFECTPVVAKMKIRGLKVNRKVYTDELKRIEELRDIAEQGLQNKVRRDGLVQGSFFDLPEKHTGDVLLTSSSQIKTALNALEVPVFSKKELEQFESYKLEEKLIEALSVEERLLLMKTKYPKFNFELYDTYKKALKEKKTVIKGTGAKAVLALNKDEYDVIGNLKEFRGTEKLISSFGENFLAFLRKYGPDHERVHANFKQIGAGTGRFSCNNPNLQQLPAGVLKIGEEKHKIKFREAFDFPVGYVGINLDYSQIELRIAAELSGDSVMISTFLSGRDLHADTASNVFGVPYETCAQEGHEHYNTYRKYAKSINFGIIYGLGADALSIQIGVTKEEAQEMINKYAKAYPELWAYLKNQYKLATQTLQARTASGRLQQFTAPGVDEFGEPIKHEVAQIGRNGMNMPIQGLSADILKIALKKVDDALKDYDAHIVNIVHDEMTVECAEKEAKIVLPIIERCMREAGEVFLQRVPVKADGKIIRNWADK